MNKRSKLTALAALGLVAGAMGTAEGACVSPKTSEVTSLMSQLDSDHKSTFNSMSCEGQNLAITLANQSCKGKNSCKGLNSCKSKQNSCAGQGSCKGTSPGLFKDKNKAVDVAQKRMQSMSK